MKRMAVCAALVGAFAMGFVLRGVVPGETVAHAQAPARVFELRTYTAVDAEKLDALHKRFRDHTVALFAKHGMENIYFWKPTDAPASGNTMLYLIAHKSRAAAKASWSAFLADPEWKKVSSESEANGRILAGPPQTIYLEAMDYSPVK